MGKMGLKVTISVFWCVVEHAEIAYCSLHLPYFLLMKPLEMLCL